MIDFFNLTDSSTNNQIFYCSSSGGTAWQVWSKPSNAKFVKFVVIGGGGGGGSGRGSSINTGAGGGGGGCSGASFGFFPANVLPDKLYISVGKGGTGGASSGGGSSNSGGAGEISYVCVLPSTASANVVMQSGAAAAGGGFGGSGSVGGAGGSAGSVWAANSVFSVLGIITALAGQGGATGGQISVGTNITAASFLTGGASGAYVPSNATSYSGGSIVFGGSVPTLLGSQNSSGDAPDASGGFSFGIPDFGSSTEHIFISSGGAGGGSSNANPSAASGGDGGNASFGSGGGGGGACYNGNGGAGGRGGNGLVIINCI